MAHTYLERRVVFRSFRLYTHIKLDDLGPYAYEKTLEKTDVRGWHSEFVHVGRGSHVHASLSWRFPRVRGREVNHRRIVQ